jgi:hypothetical protein
MKNTQMTVVRLDGSVDTRRRLIRVRGAFIFVTALLAFSSLIVPTNTFAACEVDLVWANTADIVDGFKIERAPLPAGPWAQIDQVPASQTSYADATVISGLTYYYRVRAYNAAGNSGYSNVDGASPACSGIIDSIGDGISDLWRLTYFGGSGLTTNSQSCATCDADGTGQNNLFKYAAGLDPTKPSSVFTLKIATVAGQPNQKTLTFSPINSGRTYIVESRTNMFTGSYVALSGMSAPQTNGNQVTVTDLNATQASKFYRIHISQP